MSWSSLVLAPIFVGMLNVTFHVKNILILVFIHYSTSWVLALFFFPCGCRVLLIFAFQITFYAKCHQVLVHAGGGNLWREFANLGG